jgi:hypothetical protein
LGKERPLNLKRGICITANYDDKYTRRAEEERTGGMDKKTGQRWGARGGVV